MSVEFDDDSISLNYTARPEPKERSLKAFLIKIGLVKNENQAYLVLAIFAFILIAFSVFIIYSNSARKAIPYRNISNETKQKLPVAARQMLEKQNK